MKNKKLLLGALFCIAVSVNAYAEYEMHGQISSVNEENKTITLIGNGGANVVVQVFPYTKLKGDDCGAFGAYDTYEKFTALKAGMFVQVDGMPNANGLVSAKEIEWKCGKKAY